MQFDLLIRNGRVVDGTGNPWFYGDIGIKADRIATIQPRGLIDPQRATEVVDATDHVICPGFIDIQSHSVATLFNTGQSLGKVTQGVTTEIMGEGRTPAPFGGRVMRPHKATLRGTGEPEVEKEWKFTRFREWLETYERRRVAVNIGSFVGGGTIREYAKGWDVGEPTVDELETMKRVTEECMREGAFGIAPALIYPPSSFACTHELVELAKVVARFGGVYISHVRSEAAQLIEGIDESIEIGRRSGCAIEVYHLKASGEANWHKMDAVIANIERARAQGIDITADMYPYVGSGTGLNVLIPTWAYEGNMLYQKLADPGIRERLHREMMQPTEFTTGRNPEVVMPIGFEKAENKQYAGKRLTEIAEIRGENWIDAMIELLLSEQQRIFTIFFAMSEENVKKQLKLPWMKISTDAGGMDPSTAKTPTHPRGYGTYTRVLGKYVREEKTINLEDAIRKMSGAVADRIGLRDRGVLRTGHYADVVIFDPQTVADRATFTDSHRLSVGIRDVWVNGGRVIENTKPTGKMPGRIVDGPGRGR